MRLSCAPLTNNTRMGLSLFLKSTVLMLHCISRNQALYYKYVTPGAVELGMFFVNAHFPETQRSDQAAAGLVLYKYTRQQFPKTGFFGGLNQSGHRNASGAAAARFAR